MLRLKLILLAILCLTSASYAGVKITKVEVEGNRRTERQAVLKFFEGKAEMSEAEIDDIVKKLYANRLYANIEVFHDPETGLLRIKVSEHPVISDVAFTGNDDIDLDDIKGVVDLKTNELLDMDKVRRNVQKIADLYKEKGFLTVMVDSDIQHDASKSESRVTFKITEGGKSRVKKVTIVGNEHLADEYIKERLNVKEDDLFSIFSDGGYKKNLLDEDQTRIMLVYNEEGYVNARVSRPTVTISPDKKELSITFIVTEGERYKIAGTTISGDMMENGKYPEYQYKLKKDEYYRYTSIVGDIEAIKTFYGDEGYPFVTVIPERKVDEEKKTLEVTYVVQKGKKCTVERIDIEGNDRSRDKVIRREMRLYEGELYSYSGQKRSENFIRRTGFYDDVQLSIRGGSKPEYVRILVVVKERKSGTFNVGAGFSSFESFVFNARIDQSNFMGYGQTISLLGQVSKMKQEVNLSLIEPYFFDYNLSLYTAFYFVKTDYSSLPSGYNYGDYEDNRVGYSFSFGKPLGDYFTASLGYRIDKTFIRGGIKDRIQLMFRDMLTSSVEARLSFDMRDDRQFPTKGIYSHLALEFSPTFLGSDDMMLGIDFNFKFYIPIIWGLVFRSNTQVGFKYDFDRELPISERFRLGGLFSVRGYPYASIGYEELVPEDGKDQASGTTGYVVGGNKRFVMNNELEIPILKEMRLNLVGFFDIGNAWNTDENFFYIDDHDGRNKYDLPLGLFMSAGFGVRWVTAIAPLSFEWGFPITRRPGDPVFMFEFNIKNSF